MKSPQSILDRGALTRLACSLAMAAALAIAAQTGLSAHAAPILQVPAPLYAAPHITVTDEYWGPNNPHVLPVVGSSFTVNSPVLLELVGTGGSVAVEAATTARGALHARSTHAGTFRYRLSIPAAIQLPGLRLVAIDRVSGRRSNSVVFHFPIPSCVHHPYTCI